jgi:hypothetical protein
MARTVKVEYETKAIRAAEVKGAVGSETTFSELDV